MFYPETEALASALDSNAKIVVRRLTRQLDAMGILDSSLTNQLSIERYSEIRRMDDTAREDALQQLDVFERRVYWDVVRTHELSLFGRYRTLSKPAKRKVHRLCCMALDTTKPSHWRVFRSVEAHYLATYGGPLLGVSHRKSRVVSR